MSACFHVLRPSLVAVALLGGFMKFIGEEEVWNNMQKAKAIPRAFAWFKGALNALRGFVNEIPGLFVQAFKSLEVADIILIPRAFMKLASGFGGFAARFIVWGAGAIWHLLEIIFDAVSPGALLYIKKTGAALKSILKNPLPFVGNLVKAAKLGFSNFATIALAVGLAFLFGYALTSLPLLRAGLALGARFGAVRLPLADFPALLVERRPRGLNGVDQEIVGFLPCRLERLKVRKLDNAPVKDRLALLHYSADDDRVGVRIEGGCRRGTAALSGQIHVHSGRTEWRPHRFGEP